MQVFFHYLLREIEFITSANNILVEVQWLVLKANSLASAFLQFNEKYITNIYLSL